MGKGLFTAASFGLSGRETGMRLKELEDQGIKPNTIRLSIGTEHIDDIIADLQNGFDAIK